MKSDRSSWISPETSCLCLSDTFLNLLALLRKFLLSRAPSGHSINSNQPTQDWHVQWPLQISTARLILP